MYVATKGGEAAIENSHALIAEERRGDPAVPELEAAQIREQLGGAVDRVMTEGSLYDPRPSGAGDQAGAGRPGRSDISAAGVPHDLAAVRCQRAHRHRRHDHSPPYLCRVQGPAGRAGAGADLRLHPPLARFHTWRHGARRRQLHRRKMRQTPPCRASPIFLATKD